MHVLFIFMDGIGLGAANAEINPFAQASMPVLEGMLGGKKMLAATAPYLGEHATLLALDAGMGVPGLPQSATGQATLLTGLNIPLEIGQHYGPKPNPAVTKYLVARNLFSMLVHAGKSAALLNAYPPRYFEGVDSGKRLYSAIPLAVTSAGLRLFTADDLKAGRALSADFTGEAWRQMLGFPDAPVFTPWEAGQKLTELTRQFDFSLFEYWASDYAGHKQDMRWAVQQLEVFDQVLGGILANTNGEQELILITSDHGNMEDLSTRRHTYAQVPGLLLGSASARAAFTEDLTDLAGISARIFNAIIPDQQDS